MDDIKREIVERFMRLQSLMHRYQMRKFMDVGPWGNPNRGQGRVLSILKLKPEISQKELSFLLDMSKQALAELLAKLERSGYITREASEDDRRSVNIKLTEAGAAAAGEMNETAGDIDTLFDCLNEEELLNFRDYLRRITERIEEQQPGDDRQELRRQMAERFMHQNRHFFEEHGNPFDKAHFHGYFGGNFHGGCGGGHHHDGCGRRWEECD